MALDDLDRLELSITPLAHHTRATSRGRCAAHDADAPRGRGNPPRPRPPYMDQPLGEGVPPMMQTQPRESATAASVLHRSRASGRLPVTDTHACKAIGMGKGATAASGGDGEGRRHGSNKMWLVSELEERDPWHPRRVHCWW